jgi:hypothetical protein
MSRNPRVHAWRKRECVSPALDRLFQKIAKENATRRQVTHGVSIDANSFSTDTGGVVMRVLALIGVLVATAMAAGAAMAAEDDFMALRGEARDGKTQINAFQGPWRFDSMPPLDHGGFAARPGSLFAPAREAGGDYLEWKNHCVFVPPVVAGSSLDNAEPQGFGQVAPYLEHPAPTGERFIEALVGEWREPTIHN